MLRGHRPDDFLGECCSTAASANRADSLYISELLKLVPSEYPMDAHGVYLAGFSNGGMMAYRYACEHPTQIASIGVVAGTNEATCTPGTGTGAVAVRHIHGDADTTVPYNGSDFSTFLNCPLTPVPTTLQQWQSADSGSSWATVESTLVPGMGHTWPTGSSYGIDATTTLWSFFAAHRRP